MKKIFIFGIIFLGGITFYVNSNADVLTRPEITGITKNIWKQEGTTASLADDVISADLEGINLLFDTPGAYIHEDNNGGTGSFYNLTTTFTQWTSANTSNATTGLTVDESAGTITIGTGLDGRYVGVIHASFKAPAGTTITMEVTKNSTKIDDIVRSMARGPERLPTFRSISSDGSDATYDTYSSLSYLYYADKNVVQFQEGDAGSTGCYYAIFEYENVDSPHLLVFNNTMYSGGVGHYGDVQAWDYNLSSWVDLRTATSDFEDSGGSDDYRKQNTRWLFPSNREDFVSSGKIRARVKHNNVACNPAHLFIVDETYVIDNFSSAVIAFPIEFSVIATDVLKLRFKANEDNVILNISDAGLNIFKIGL
ncbi:hypothetical protein KAR91_81900 [Candidatus Pacearchaeota archaeon]|nr:hypothetical protein [Candidatus Pacearchaeota archaeon]